MFSIVITYTAPLAEIDGHLQAHGAWLDYNYESGHFLASGRQEPRSGGMVLATATSRAEIDRIVARDPFHIQKLAEHRVIEWIPSKMVDPLKAVLA
jgi:uncharacterized protein YciI